MSARHEPHTSPKGTTPPGAIMDDVILRERAHAPVESAIRSHFATLGGGADEANIRNATSIVLRGLTPSALSRIASAGVSGSELIQTLIPKPAQANVLPAFNWSSITPAEIERLRSLGLLSDYHRKMALGQQGSPEERGGVEGSSRGASYKSELPWSEEKLSAYAHEKGVPWLANHPDLKRLTPAAIETFARMQFDRESYHALTRDAGLSPEKAHKLVSAMEAAKVAPDEAKELAKKMGATSKGLSPEQQEQHRQLMENWVKSLKADPGAAPEHLKKLHKWLDERKEADPGKAKAADDEKKATIKVQERLEEKQKLEAQSAAKLSAKEVNADDAAKVSAEKKAVVTSGLDDLNAPTVVPSKQALNILPASPPPQQPAAPSTPAPVPQKTAIVAGASAPKATI